MNEINSNSNLNPEKTICMYRWSYAIVKYSAEQSRTCCRTYPNEKITFENLNSKSTHAMINSQQSQDRRLEMLSGIRHPACSSCWKLEDAGIQSPRTSVDQFVEYIHQREGGPVSFSDILENKDKYLISNNPQIVEIQIDNLCDLKCIYCNEEYSNRWEKEKLASGEITEDAAYSKHKTSELFLKTFWSWLGSISANLQYINFIGGEPLLSPQFYKILDFLLSDQFKSKNRIMISIVSNLNSNDVYFEKFISYFQLLSEKFDLSIDASSEARLGKGEFIREGLKWNRFEKNVEVILDQIVNSANPNKILNFGFHIANNLLSASSLLDYITWIKSLEDKYNYPIHLRQNIVTFPEHLSPVILTNDFSEYYFKAAEYILKNRDPNKKYYQGVDWLSYAHFLKSIGDSILKAEPNAEIQKRFADWVLKSEKKRNIHFLQIFPELKQFFQLCQSL